jgi:uncharacterized membrane protein
LSVSDALLKWKIPNVAIQSKNKDLNNVVTPALCHVNNSNSPLIIITKISEADVTSTIDNKRFNSESIKDFLDRWTGIYLSSNPSEFSGEEEYRKVRVGNILRSTALGILGCLLIVLIGQRFLNIVSSLPKLWVEYITPFLIAFLGVIVTGLILWHEIDKNNPLLKSVCTGFSKGNCSAVLTSKYSKIFNLISWGEIGFYYFAGAFTSLLLSVNEIKSTLYIISIFFILASPYILYSIYFQWKVIRQWCFLCLIVQLLILIGVLDIVWMRKDFLIVPDRLSLSPILIGYLIPVLSWQLVKPFLLNMQIADSLKRSYLRIKFNPSVFETLLDRQKKTSVSIEGIGIDLGNQNASNSIIKVCNPFCDPCSMAHPEIEKLLDNNDNLKVKIVFTVPNIPSHNGYKIVTHLMQLANDNTNRKLLVNALDTWYSSKEKSYEEFAEKYPLKVDFAKYGRMLDEMSEWCEKMKIEFTPTFFFNGKQLPQGYSIKDLQYFLYE